jgi:hypothetical protein
MIRIYKTIKLPLVLYGRTSGLNMEAECASEMLVHIQICPVMTQKTTRDSTALFAHSFLSLSLFLSSLRTVCVKFEMLPVSVQ